MVDVDDLVPVSEAAERAGVGHNTMLLAAKKGKIKAKRLGRGWFIYSSDIERWKSEDYRPDMAFHHPAKPQDDQSP